MRHRIFLAVNLPEEAKEELSRWKEKWPELPARWTRKENLHITLVFLGNTSEKELEEVKRAAGEAAGRHEPFLLSFSQIVYGPSPKNPRMVWATPEKNSKLLSLQKDLERTLAAADIAFVPEKRGFSPHLTLARFDQWAFRRLDPEERPEVQEEIRVQVHVESVEVMESTLKRAGAEYAIVERIPLRV